MANYKALRLDYPDSLIVLTLPMTEQEGHQPYLPQSAYPAKGTAVGGRIDNLRRDHTWNAPARHQARAGAGQRQRGLPRTGDLADGLLSLAQAGALRCHRRPPAPAARPGGAPGGDDAGGGAAGARDFAQRRQLEVPTNRGLSAPDLAGATSAQHRPPAAPGRIGHAKPFRICID
jgi:hypothetical protein